jgi:hypothetical protein
MTESQSIEKVELRYENDLQTPLCCDHRELLRKTEAEVEQLQVLLLATSQIPGIKIENLKLAFDDGRKKGSLSQVDLRDAKIIQLARRVRELSTKLQRSEAVRINQLQEFEAKSLLTSSSSTNLPSNTDEWKDQLDLLKGKVKSMNEQLHRERKAVLSLQTDLVSKSNSMNELTNTHVEVLALYELEKTKLQASKARIHILEEEFSKSKQHVHTLIDKSEKDDQLIDQLRASMRESNVYT